MCLLLKGRICLLSKCVMCLLLKGGLQPMEGFLRVLASLTARGTEGCPANEVLTHSWPCQKTTNITNTNTMAYTNKNTNTNILTANTNIDTKQIQIA